LTTTRRAEHEHHQAHYPPPRAGRPEARAGPTGADSAAIFRAAEAQRVAQRPKKRRIGFDVGAVARFTGTGSGTNLTVTSVSGTISIGGFLQGSGIVDGSYIVSQSSGTAGGAGVYVLSKATTSSAATIVSYLGRTSGSYIRIACSDRLNVERVQVLYGYQGFYINGDSGNSSICQYNTTIKNAFIQRNRIGAQLGASSSYSGSLNYLQNDPKALTLLLQWPSDYIFHFLATI